MSTSNCELNQPSIVQCPVWSLTTANATEAIFENLNDNLKDVYIEASNLLPSKVKYACKKNNQDIKSCFLGYVVPNSDKDYSTITGGEAYRFNFEASSGKIFDQKKLSFLQNENSVPNKFKDLLVETSKALADKFSLDRLDGATRRAKFGERILHPIKIIRSVDGDTFELLIYWGGLDCKPIKTKIRFSGIDTPESKVVGKFTPQLEAIMNEYQPTIIDNHQKKFELKGKEVSHLESILKKRMSYIGKIAALISEGFVQYLADLSPNGEIVAALEESFLRYVKSGDKSCDMVELIDQYGRILGMINTIDPEVINHFITKKLPKIMTSDKAKALYTNATTYSQEEIEWIENLKKDVPRWYDGILSLVKDVNRRTELANILDPKNVFDPSKIYSQVECEKIETAWAKNSSRMKREGDYNASLVLMGGGWAYLKYRNHVGSEYRELSNVASNNNFGMRVDPIFNLIDPLKNGLDKGKNVFTEPLIPADCLTGEK